MEEITSKQAEYYGGLFKKHGASVDAVASGDQIYKDLRYSRLSRLFGEDKRFSLHEVGFGVGHYLEYLRTAYPDREIAFSGSEVTEPFVSFCRSKYPQQDWFLQDISTQPSKERYDYVVCAGTFYHLADANPDEYWDYMQRTLVHAFHMSTRGVSFNCITGYCEFFKPDLFYCPLERLVPFVAQKLSRFFWIDHCTPLYEYTMGIYHPEYVVSLHPEEQFKKYFKA